MAYQPNLLDLSSCTITKTTGSITLEDLANNSPGLDSSNNFTGINTVPAVTDFTTNQILDAKTADARYSTQVQSDARYFMLASTALQTVTGPVTFNSDIHLKTSGDGGTPQIYYDRNGIPAFSMGVNDSGTLFVARYDSTSTGKWLGSPITIDGGTGAVAIYATITVPDITDFTGQTALNAKTAEARYAAIEWVDSHFLQLNNSSYQTVTGPVTFSGITTVPTPTDYTQKQAIGASDADARYARLTGGNSWSGTQNFGGDVVVASGSKVSVVAAGGAGSCYMWPEYYASGNLAGLNAVTHVLDSGGNSLAWVALSGSNGRLYTNKGTVAFTSDLPTAGVISGGTYTKTPMNDGTGRSVLVQTFTSVMNTDGGAIISFPITYSAAPIVLAGSLGSGDGTTDTDYWVSSITTAGFFFNTRNYKGNFQFSVQGIVT